MATTKVTTTTKVPVKYLRARCGVRYWEDGTVNGVQDDDGSRIPCRNGTAAGGGEVLADERVGDRGLGRVIHSRAA